MAKSSRSKRVRANAAARREAWGQAVQDRYIKQAHANLTAIIAAPSLYSDEQQRMMDGVEQQAQLTKKPRARDDVKQAALGVRAKPMKRVTGMATPKDWLPRDPLAEKRKEAAAAAAAAAAAESGSAAGAASAADASSKKSKRLKGWRAKKGLSKTEKDARLRGNSKAARLRRARARF